MDTYENLYKVVASHYRVIGDKTEFGQQLVNNLVILSLDLVSRGKETLNPLF